MRTLIAAAIATLVSACATPLTPSADVTRISYQVSSWGYVQERWTIAANGEATFERTPTSAQLGAPLQPPQAFTLTPADFERIRTTLAPTERFIGGGLACEAQMTDAPYGTVKWQRSSGAEQQVSFYAACRETPDITLFFAQLSAADRTFHQLTGTSEG